MKGKGFIGILLIALAAFGAGLIVGRRTFTSPTLVAVAVDTQPAHLETRPIQTNLTRSAHDIKTPQKRLSLAEVKAEIQRLRTDRSGGRDEAMMKLVAST